MINYNYKYVRYKEYKRILGCAYHHNVEHGLIIELIGNGGLRVSECLELIPDDFDYENNMIVITTLKQKQHPKIPVTYPVGTMQVMKVYITRMGFANKEKIFTVTRQGIWKMFKKYCRELKLNKHYTVHSLRHMHGTLVSEATNGNRDAVRNRLRHKDSTTADIYTHLTEGLTKKIIDKLESNDDSISL